jgi:hypothetical protein
VHAREWNTGDGPKTIFADGVKWLRENAVLLPGVTTAARLLATCPAERAEGRSSVRCPAEEMKWRLKIRKDVKEKGLYRDPPSRTRSHPTSLDIGILMTCPGLSVLGRQPHRLNGSRAAAILVRAVRAGLMACLCLNRFIARTSTYRKEPVRMRRRFTGKALIAAALMTVSALAGSVTPAGAATRAAADSSILNAAAGDRVHHCVNLAYQQGTSTSPGGYEPVVCVDIETNSYTGGYDTWGAVEAYCQVGATAKTVPCARIYIDGIFANASGTQSPFSRGCSGNCDSGRPSEFSGVDFSYTGGHDCASSLGHNVWTVAVGDTEIETPDGDVFDVSGSPNDSGNYSSGHYWVCP